MYQENIKCTILGSFKFKREIDLCREEFEDNGVLVLAPEKGQVYSPPNRRHIQIAASFRPLPTERYTPIKAIEDAFLMAISQSNLAYLVDINGYVGSTVSLEIGFILARNIFLYASETINSLLDPDPYWQDRVQKIPVMSVVNTIQYYKSTLSSGLPKTTFPTGVISNLHLPNNQQPPLAK
jgi:hypothetical protein